MIKNVSPGNRVEPAEISRRFFKEIDHTAFFPVWREKAQMLLEVKKEKWDADKDLREKHVAKITSARHHRRMMQTGVHHREEAIARANGEPIISRADVRAEMALHWNNVREKLKLEETFCFREMWENGEIRGCAILVKDPTELAAVQQYQGQNRLLADADVWLNRSETVGTGYVFVADQAERDRVKIRKAEASRKYQEWITARDDERLKLAETPVGTL